MLGSGHISKRNYEAKVASKVDLDERRRDKGDAGPIIVSNVQGRLELGLCVDGR